MKLMSKIITTVMKHADIEVIEPTLLTIREYYKYYSLIPLISDDWWWLRSPGSCSSYVACVDNYGVIDEGGYNVYNECSVRPALRVRLNNSSELKVKDEFCFRGYWFTIISKNLAICNTIIGGSRFSDNDNNDFDQSTIKEELNKWFNSEDYQFED